MNPEKLKQFESIITLLKESVSREEFLQAFKTLSDFVVKIEKQNSKEFDGMWSKVNTTLEQIKSTTISELSTLKSTLEKEQQTKHDAMMKDCKGMFSKMESKMEEVKSGENGKDADEENIVNTVLERIVIPEYKETELDDGKKIVAKINDLNVSEENQIDWSHIKNAPDFKANTRVGRTKVFTDTSLSGDGTSSNPLTIVGGGLIPLFATGDIDDVNVDYVFTEKPTYIVQNSVWYRENLGWTWNAGTSTATMSVPTQTGSDIFAFK